MKEEASEKVSTKIQWINFKQQFFSSILVSKNNFTSADISQTTNPENSGYTKNFTADIRVPFNPTTKSVDMAFYFGPNLFKELKKYDQGFEKVVPLGGCEDEDEQGSVYIIPMFGREEILVLEGDDWND